jgi:uncharacterized membrane protein
MKHTRKTTHIFTHSIVAGILSSFVFLCLGGRLTMRVLAILAQQEPRFTIEGTIAILVFSTSIGIVGGILLPLVQKDLPGSPNTKGSAWGLLLFIVLIPMLPPTITDEVMGAQQFLPLAIVLFGLLFLGFGATMEFLRRVLESSPRRMFDIDTTQPTY